MSCDINETITTELKFTDVVNIAVAIGEYLRLYGHDAPDEIKKEMTNLVDRLGREMYDYKPKK